MDFSALFATHKASELYGRYITASDIQPLVQKCKTLHQVITIGRSVLGEPIYLCKAGSGNVKILIWSQMHGNESTTTKALFDFFNFLERTTSDAARFLEHFTFYAIPMLNPDGAKAYTRENANGIDLNRDFANLTQPESRALYSLFKEVEPDFCYNLHDQRTIYAVGETQKPATVSFLSPAYNDSRDINGSRLKAINVIVAMNRILQRFIPGQVGRFDDGFNINCAGDTFQYHNAPTILFEAGHYSHDYDREESRKYIFFALVAGIDFIVENVIVDNGIEEYLNIPQNKIAFYDFVYKNVKINYDGIEKITNFAAQYREELLDNKIVFCAHIAEVDIAGNVVGHMTIDGKGELFQDNNGHVPELDSKADFYIGNMKFVNGLRA